MVPKKRTCDDFTSSNAADGAHSTKMYALTTTFLLSAPPPKASEQVASLERTIKEYQEQIQRLKKENSDLRAQKKSQNVQIETLRLEYDVLERQRKTSEFKCVSEKTWHRDTIRGKEMLKGENLKLRKIHHELLTKYSRTKADAEQTEQKKDEWVATAKAHKQQLTETACELVNCKAALEKEKGEKSFKPDALKGKQAKKHVESIREWDHVIEELENKTEE